MDFEMRLDYQDSNLDKQNQNLLCYHYTIVQQHICKHLTVFLSKKARITRNTTQSTPDL